MILALKDKKLVASWPVLTELSATLDFEKAGHQSSARNLSTTLRITLSIDCSRRRDMDVEPLDEVTAHPERLRIPGLEAVRIAETEQEEQPVASNAG